MAKRNSRATAMRELADGMATLLAESPPPTTTRTYWYVHVLCAGLGLERRFGADDPYGVTREKLARFVQTIRRRGVTVNVYQETETTQRDGGTITTTTVSKLVEV